jgi:hypothetical protein
MKKISSETISPIGIKPRIETHPLFKKKSAAFEKALLFCSYLFVRTRHFNNTEDKNPYQRIRNDKVRIILGDKFVEYKQALVDLGIIEIDKLYIGGSKSRGYRLTKEFCNQKVKIRKIRKLVVRKKLKRIIDNNISLQIKKP